MIKILLKSLLCFILLYNTFSLSVNAHPGRTDEDGGHTCRTNCDAWGLDYGEYHYHYSSNNGSGAKNKRDDNSSNGSITIIDGDTLLNIIVLSLVGYFIYTNRKGSKNDI